MENFNQYGSSPEKFRSWGERQIARFLDRHEIDYQYEYPLALVDRGQVRLYYPDFRLPDYGLIMEYFGLRGRPDYDAQVRHKLALYRQAGIEGIFMNKDSFKGDWPIRLLDQIEGSLEQRYRQFQCRRG